MTATPSSTRSYRAMALLAMAGCAFVSVASAGPADTADPAAPSVELVDEIAGKLLAGLESCRKLGTQAVLDLIDDDLPGLPGSDQQPKRGKVRVPSATTRVDALSLFREYAVEFDRAAKDGTPRTLSPELAGKFAAATRTVCEKGRLARAGILGEGTARVAELCFVLPLLAMPDSQWSAANTKSLPAWMTDGKGLPALERFALCAGRPLTAWSLASAREKAKPPGRVAYLCGATDELLEAGELGAARLTSTAGAEIAEAAGDSGTAAKLHLKTARAFADAGHAEKAIKHLRAVALRFPQLPECATISAGLARHLYDDDQVASARDLARDCLDGRRCGDRKAEFLYLHWLACRRLGETGNADASAREFLAAFPEHAWAADIHLVSGMRAFADGNDDEANRAFKLIRTTFPDARAARRLSEFRNRLTRLELITVDAETGLWRRTE